MEKIKQVVLPGDKIRLIHPEELVHKFGLNSEKSITFPENIFPLDDYRDLYRDPTLPIVEVIDKNGNFIIESKDNQIPNETVFDVIVESKNTIAFSEESTFQKEITIIDRKDRLLLSFGEPYTYELDLFIEDVAKEELKDICIDGGGRNHGTSSVYASGEDVRLFIEEFLKKYNLSPEKGINRKKYFDQYINVFCAILPVKQEENSECVYGPKI